MLESERAGARRWTAALASVLLASGSVAACAHGASGPGSSNGIGGDGGGPEITGAGGHPSSGPSMSGPSTMSGSPVGAGGAGATTSSTGSGPCGETPCKLAAPQCGCSGGRRRCNPRLERTCASCVAAGAAGSNGETCSGPNRLRARAHLPHGVGVGATPGAASSASPTGDCTGGTCSVSLSNGTMGTSRTSPLCSTTCNSDHQQRLHRSAAAVASSVRRPAARCAGSRVVTPPAPASRARPARRARRAARGSGASRARTPARSARGSATSTPRAARAGRAAAGSQDQNMQPIVVDGVTYGACLPP